MKNIIIALLISLPVFSFTENKTTASLESSCNPCTVNSVVEFIGSGFTPGKFIHVIMTAQDNNTIEFDGGSANQDGNVFLSASFDNAGVWNVKVYEVKNRTHFIYKAEITITIQ